MKLASVSSTSHVATHNSAVPTVTLAPARREVGVDIWRGLAVMIMMLTHAIGFFHVGSDALMQTLGDFGGTVSFTMFLFLAGVSVYLGFIRLETRGERINKMLRRVGYILIGYLAVSFVAIFPSLTFPPGVHWVQRFVEVLTLQNIPPFTEFILPFILFALIVIVAKPVLNVILKYPLVTILIGIALYTAGQLLYLLPAEGLLLTVKELIAGNSDTHRFPILQYAIVYLLGMQWGHFLLHHQGIKQRLRTALFAFAGSALLLAAAVLTLRVFEWDFLLGTMQRFPPAVGFILIGFIVGFVIFYLITATDELDFWPSAQALLNYMGQNAFLFFAVHTILLYLYRFVSADSRVESGLMVLILYVILVVATVVLCAGWQALLANLKSNPQSRSGEFGWLLNERILVSLVWIGIVLVVGLSIFQQRVSATTLNPEEIAFRKRLIREQRWPFWWDHTYNYFNQINIENSGSETLVRGKWFQFSFDHASLVANGQARADGGDIRIVYYLESQDKFLELPIVFTGINTNPGTVNFQLEEDIPVGTTTDKYFFYYGNPTAVTYPASNATVTNVSTTLTMNPVQSHKLSGQTNRRWILKEGGVSLQLRTLLYTVQLNAELSTESIVTFKVAGTTLSGRMDNLGNGKYQAAVDVTELPVGVYRIQASAVTPENRLVSDDSGYTVFFVTYPLYVTWTQDWDTAQIVSDNTLAQLDELANRYGVPMTHFFNPRIYLPSYPQDRTNAYTLFVQKRQKDHGDEIGLHLHMWWDMVEAAGVAPKYGPTSPWLYGGGGGVKISAYNTAEMKQILNWSKRKFQENGLSIPISFRSGGWYMSLEVMQALDETGFLIESSGRVYPTSPLQLQDPPPWNLSITQRPYKPSRSDFNLSTAPTFNIWEFPNNVGDSIWYSPIYGDPQELIRRFDLNYADKGSVITEPQVLTYLSHPDFFSIDQPVMTNVFNHVGQYLYKNDAGPVIYTTLENAYYSWDKN